MPAGRPAFEITDEVLKKVETLAAQGLSKREVALCLGISVSTYCDKQSEYPEFSEAYDSGSSKGVAKVANALYTKAIDGDVTAQKHYLNNRGDGWSERQTREISGPGGDAIQTDHMVTLEFVGIENPNS